MKPGECLHRCWVRRHKFGLLVHKGLCRCADVLRGMVQVGQEECLKPCVFNNSQACGGDGTFLTYYTGYIAEPQYTQITLSDIKAAYDGCYEDPAYTVLCQYHVTSVRMRVAMCMSFCEDYVYQLAAMDMGERCCCGETTKETYSVKENFCHKDCKDGEKQFSCGGDEGYLSVYRTGITEVPGRKRKPPKPKKYPWLAARILEKDIVKMPMNKTVPERRPETKEEEEETKEEKGKEPTAKSDKKGDQ